MQSLAAAVLHGADLLEAFSSGCTHANALCLQAAQAQLEQAGEELDSSLALLQGAAVIYPQRQLALAALVDCLYEDDPLSSCQHPVIKVCLPVQRRHFGAHHGAQTRGLYCAVLVLSSLVKSYTAAAGAGSPHLQRSLQLLILLRGRLSPGDTSLLSAEPFCLSQVLYWTAVKSTAGRQQQQGGYSQQQAGSYSQQQQMRQQELRREQQQQQQQRRRRERGLGTAMIMGDVLEMDAMSHNDPFFMGGPMGMGMGMGTGMGDPFMDPMLMAGVQAAR